MIRFSPVPEPAAFDAEVRQRGKRWLQKNPKERPIDYWGKFKGELSDGFGHLCAYSAMYEPVGTVDHFVSCDEDRSQAYEWSNYRFASGWLNSSKQNITASQIIDPFEVKDGWFRILLPSLQLVVEASMIPQSLLPKAEFVLKRLHLRDDERVLRQRREWYRMYQDEELTLAGLYKKAPLIARAVDEHRVLKAISAETTGARKRDVMEATGIDSSDWKRIVSVLLNRGTIRKTGRGRGTKYHVKASKP